MRAAKERLVRHPEGCFKTIRGLNIEVPHLLALQIYLILERLLMEALLKLLLEGSLRVCLCIESLRILLLSLSSW